MSLFEKFKKNLFDKNKNPLSKLKSKLFNEKVANEIAQQDIQSIEDAINNITIDKTKTLERLDILEEWIALYAPKINDNHINVNALRQQHDREIREIKDLMSNDKLADRVLDTTDNQYKNVKQIIIDKAINTNQVLYKGNYTTIENILTNYIPTIPPFPNEIEYARHSGYADKIRYGDSIISLDNVMLGYLHKDVWSDIIRNADTFEQFKTNLINKLALQ